MKTITIDFSGETTVFPEGKAIGCEGTHNAVSLTAILPERLISRQISAYTMLFLNGSGDVICSDNLTLNENRVNCTLWEQLLCGKELSIQVQGIGFENGEIKIIDKTSVAVLEIERSIGGNAVETNEKASDIYAHISQIKDELKNLKLGAATDFENLTNKPFTYVPDAFLDAIIEEGLYFADKYAYTKNGEHTGWFTGRDTAVFIRNVDYEKTMIHQPIIMQIVSTPIEFLSRQYDKINGIWGEMSVTKYLSDVTPIIPLVETVTDGTAIFDLDDMPYILRNALKHRRVLETDKDCSFILPNIQPQAAGDFSLFPDKSILVYAHFTQEVSVDWGENVIFYNGEVPEIKAGYFDIIFTFDPNAQKWCVGVIPKGAVE
ncbi:MAG: hypothetical protein IKU25_03040 [Clostridia bacterium]|nr:hypothetical protein [Clostridia bacterium]